MAPKRQALILIVLSLLTINTSSEAATGGIAIYWGQNNGDGTLRSTCDTGNYEIVLLSFLTTFGCGRTPQLNFAGYCSDWNPCTKLKTEIEYCQYVKNVKVFLSLGGATGSYSLCSPEDAKEVANYLFSNWEVYS
ncbi:Glycoside hydrolase family 18, catalytic domain [Sesbania bispinosa]|nr:Glycoside hydrolase family 18, catalytic domain [Sesbania bispinosa]